MREVWAFITHDVPRMERIGDRVVYARLPTFDMRYQHLTRAHWVHRRLDERVLIIDLRDNSGGAVEYGLNALAEWINPNLIAFKQLGTQLVSSCLYPALRWNSGMGGTPQLLLDSTAGNIPLTVLGRWRLPNPSGHTRSIASRRDKAECVSSS